MNIHRIITCRLTVFTFGLLGLFSVVVGPVRGQSRTTGAAKTQRQYFQEQIDEERKRFARELEKLAAEVADSGRAEDADLIRGLATPPESLPGGAIDQLPESFLLEISKSVPADERDQQLQLRTLRTEFAKALFSISRKALAVQPPHPGLAFQLIREAAYHDPDNKAARRALGYTPYQERWTTAFAAQNLRQGKKWDSRWGWLNDRDRERYESGLRLLDGHWVKAEEEATVCHHFKKAWTVETEHFRIRTNHSQERGVELGVKLEDFHRFFLREFTAVFTSPAQLGRLLEGSNPEAAPKKYEIHYFRTRDEFIQQLRGKQNGVEVINGLYLPEDRKAYFFDDPTDPESNEETLYHEVTHQLLGETSAKTLDVGKEHDFWVIEGIACYLESFERRKNRLSAGDPRHVRIVRAYQRALNEHLYEPMRPFTVMSMREFQNAGGLPQLRAYYSQAAAMVHFFLNYENGLYREEFLNYLGQVYSPVSGVRHNPKSLAQLTGVTFEVLDRQYLDYLATLAAAAKRQPAD